MCSICERVALGDLDGRPVVDRHPQRRGDVRGARPGALESPRRPGVRIADEGHRLGELGQASEGPESGRGDEVNAPGDGSLSYLETGSRVGAARSDEDCEPGRLMLLLLEAAPETEGCSHRCLGKANPDGRSGDRQPARLGGYRSPECLS